MSAFSRKLATGFYRQAAKFSARMLASSPMVESVLLHRSVATGEVFFGRSDIDMLMIINEQQAEDGASVADLYRHVLRVRRFNPALNHIDVYEPSGLETHMRADTFLASVERRATHLLCGKPVEIAVAPVHPGHALSRFLLWVEWFFAIAVQQKNSRNLWKTSLEAWNAYASAEGLISEPCLSRAEMEASARAIEKDLATERLGEPAYATPFIFELSNRLHRGRLPALRGLSKPLVFDAVTAPLCLRRRFVVVPRPDAALPPEAFVPGAFPCTPEILDLMVHTKNAFLYWILPPELRELGIPPPQVSGFLRSCGFFSERRFLLYPGFGMPGRPTQSARMGFIRHAMDWAARGQPAPPIPEAKILEMMTAGAPTVDAFYRTEYSALRRETQQIHESIAALSSAASCL